jgi:hypothetical protein
MLLTIVILIRYAKPAHRDRVQNNIRAAVFTMGQTTIQATIDEQPLLSGENAVDPKRSNYYLSGALGLSKGVHSVQVSALGGAARRTKQILVGDGKYTIILICWPEDYSQALPLQRQYRSKANEQYEILFFSNQDIPYDFQHFIEEK